MRLKTSTYQISKNYIKKVLDREYKAWYNIIKIRDKERITSEIENKCLSNI